MKINPAEYKILVVDDVQSNVLLLKALLGREGFGIVYAMNGTEALEKVKSEHPDLILLDVMMPDMDGFEVAGRLKVEPEQAEIPIIFLTAKSMKEDTIEGFSAGADDYITKPFSMEELLARVTAVLRRTNKIRSSESEEVNFKIGKYQFNSEKQILQHDGIEQKLTTKESQLLRLLCVHQNDVLDRTFALKSIWQDDNYFNGRSMDVYIAKLRKYLKDDSKVEIINIHGKGFKLLVNQ